MNETQYQTKLIRKLERIFPGCLIMKNDPTYRQGIPDLLILHNDFWAMLEVKVSADAPVQPNQTYFVDYLNKLSFSAIIFPENEKEVLRGIQQAFEHRR